MLQLEHSPLQGKPAKQDKWHIQSSLVKTKTTE